MKVLKLIAGGALGALLGVVVLVFGPWWVPQRVALEALPMTDLVVSGDVTFMEPPPAGYRDLGWDAMVLCNDAGDSFFVWWYSGELWQVAPPWCDVVPR